MNKFFGKIARNKLWPLASVTVLVALIFASAVIAAPITIIDDAGADDQPGQKDLNFLTIDYAPSVGDIAVTWGWDDTQWSGNNTGDACTLFDTNSNGFADYSLCITVNQDGSYQSTRLYACTADSRSDRCAGPTQVLSFLSTGNASIQAVDPFGTAGRQANDCSAGGATGCLIQDTVAELTVDIDDVGGNIAKLINVCSYPSQEPNSDPSDCVITPDNGFLTIKKVDNKTGDTTTFNFTTSPAAQDGTSSYSVDGTGDAATLKSYAPTTSLSVTETIPDGWVLDSNSCVIQTDPPTETGTDSGDSVTGVEIRSGLETICTFTNSEAQGTLTLVKTVINDNGGTATADDFQAYIDSTEVEWNTAYSYAAGTQVTASEAGVAGYTAGDWGGDCATDGTVTIEAGVDKTCTITNDDNAPSLTLVKEVINDNGGTAVAGDWTLSAGSNSVTGSETGELATDQAGTYALSETSVTGYTNTSITCDDDPGVEVTSVTLDVGETVTCTFVNDDDAPSLTLVKEVINDNGGTAVAGDWTLTASGYDAASPDAGTYNLSESGPSGYTQTSLTCDNAQGQVTSVTLDLGEDVTCTFVNDDDAPSLTLVKHVVNDNGGTAVAGDWTLSAGSNSVTGSESGELATDQAGTYALSETSVTGYTNTSITCDDDPGVEVTSVTLALGENKTCTFVNDDDAPSLTLVKHVVNDNGGTAVAGDWTLSAGSNSVTGSESGELATDQAGTYALSETSVTGYTNTSITCDDDPGVEVTSVTLALGENKTCTFVNDDDAPSLTLVKHVVNDNGGTAVAGDWTLTASGYDAASPDAGTYNLSESGPSGYTQTSLTCDNAQGQVTSVTLGLGEDVTCTFVNDDIAPQLIVIKHVIGGPLTAASFTLDSGGTNDSPDNFAGSESGTTVTLNAGSYNVTEANSFGYVVTYSTDCSGSIGVGETKTCTVTNRYIDYGQISPTGTTCQQYVSGTAVDFDVYYASQGGVVQYQVKANKISATNPGVFFYWTGLSQTITGSGPVFINQEDDSANIGPFAPVPNDIKLWLVTGTTCAQVQLAANQITISNGDVTVNIATAAPAGSYYVISVKYDTGSVVGQSAAGKPTVKFTFTTDVGNNGSIEETDTKGITLAPKK